MIQVLDSQFVEKTMNVSVIIPTLNEVENIGKLVEFLRQHGDERLLEVIVADGGSNDQTVELAESAGAKTCKNLPRSRAIQMNAGWKKSSGNVLYFVHADALPPRTYLSDIAESLSSGADMGCYRFQFDSDSMILKFNSYMTRFNGLSCRGGDQTLFITREAFKELGGYDQSFEIMEEYDLLIRAKKKFTFTIIPKDVKVSARKYQHNSYLRVNFANFVVFMMFRLGFSSGRIKNAYFRLLRHPKALSE